MELRPSDTMETWTNTDLSQARLTIHSFAPEQHRGFYEVLVTNPAGVAVVATWTIRQAGRNAMLCTEGEEMESSGCDCTDMCVLPLGLCTVADIVKLFVH